MAICTIGMWFKPLPDEIAHKISKKFQLYRDDKFLSRVNNGSGDSNTKSDGEEVG